MKFVVVLGLVCGVFLLDAQGKHAPTCNASKQRRIVGGEVVSVKNFPYMASLVIKWIPFKVSDGFAGGASIISNEWAITAAHCIRHLKAPYNFIAHGRAYVRGKTMHWPGQEGGDYFDHKIILAVMHELYEDESHDYDIALVKVAKRFGGRHEKPIQLPGPKYVYKPVIEATILGWSMTTADVEPFVAPELRAVVVKTIDYHSCWKFYSDADYPDFNPITPRMMCAAGLAEDACISDSGGLLTDGHILIGVVSWGVDCANEKQPGVYTKIETVFDWIKTTVIKY